MRKVLGAGLLLAACGDEPPCGAIAPASGGRAGEENVLVVILDDVGIDQVPAYEVGGELPDTPAIDCLCDRGVRFRNAWATPFCTPTRAALLSGVYPHRLGIGRYLDLVQDTWELPLEVQTVAEIVRAEGYTTGLAGKWHLSAYDSPSGYTHPELQGFDRYAGALGNLQQSSIDPVDLGYKRWEKTVNGAPRMTRRYPTVDTTDDALHLVEDLPEPWFVVVSYNAPHEPIHAPPERLMPGALPDDAPAHEKYRAMIEVVDGELQRLFQRMDPEVLANTTVVLLGDNGTPKEGVRPPVEEAQRKGSLREGGMRIPLVIAGPRVAVRGVESEALVSVVDLLPTIAEIAGAPIPAGLDGMSLLPQLADPGAPAHAQVLAHVEREEGGLDYAVRDERYKLIRTVEGRFELYELDPHDLEEELLDLGELAPEAAAHFITLSAFLDREAGP